MAISKLIFNGVTQMDVTQDTVTSSAMLNGITATGNDGVGVTGNIASKSSSDLTVSGATVSVPAGHYASSASKSVASGTEGTPTATKGAVSNHSVSVTPSVTNTAGYISGGSKTGTAVSVSASELVSGTKTITENGTGIDVSNYANVDVAVSGGGSTYTATITGTGSSGYCFVKYPDQTGTQYYTSGDTFDIEAGEIIYVYAEGSRSGGRIYVNNMLVAGEPTGYTIATYRYKVPANSNVEISLEYSSESNIYITDDAGAEYEIGEYRPTEDIARPTISFTNTHTEPPTLVLLFDKAGTTNTTTYTNYSFTYCDYYRLWTQKPGIPYDSSTLRYALVTYTYRTTSTTQTSLSLVQCTHNSDEEEPETPSNAYPRYWVDETSFRPYANSAERYWRSARTYLWIAVWSPRRKGSSS